MKKNITINLFGALYNIDEDAYQLLDNYLQSMKRYFASKDGGEEIANDIEHRVAELLWTMKEQGMEAINIEVIKTIISTIGNAEQIAAEDDNAENTTESPKNSKNGSPGDDTTDNTSTQPDEQWDPTTASLWDKICHHFDGRRLYRDPDNMILGGVCSGISTFFGFGDPVLWRLILLLLFVVQGVGLIAYIILWIIVPLAHTPEDRLRMKGVKPTPESINKQILQDQANSENRANGGSRNNGSGCLKLLLALLLLPFIIFLLLFLCIGTSMFLGFASLSSGLIGAFFPDFLNTSGIMGFTGIVCIVVFLSICLFSLIRWLFGSRKPMSSWTKTILIVITGLSLIWAAFSITRTVTNFVTLAEEYDRNHSSYSYKPKAQPQYDIPHMKEVGFHVTSNNTVRCTWAGDYPTGDGERRYMDACNYYESLLFEVERTDTVAPGHYDLYALVRAQDSGAVVYVRTEATQVVQHIPACGNTQGDLWKWACGNATIQGIERAYPQFCTDSVRTNIIEAHEGQGFGWSVACVQEIIVGKDSLVHYGISTFPSITSCIEPECDWVSATDFVLLPKNKRKK